jgi:hypothetical protein
MEFLGLKVQDKVTGFKGVVTSVSYDLYGCVQLAIHQEYKDNEKGELPPGHWFDSNRVNVLEWHPVMDIPDFSIDKGPAEKPLASSLISSGSARRIRTDDYRSR